MGVGRVAGVEIGGVGFDDEDEVGGIVWGVGAGGEDEREEKSEESLTQRRRGRREERNSLTIEVRRY